jgi:MoaA/NifB/PqqE/SkfB family radical SAM enzyme
VSLALWHWHIEISSKCTLKCPRCPRQEVPDTLVNTELELAFFTRNFPPDFITEHVEKLTFCGDDGDPIYARDFIHVIKYFKSVGTMTVTMYIESIQIGLASLQVLLLSMTSQPVTLSGTQ